MKTTEEILTKAPLSIKLAILYPSRFNISVMRKINRIRLSTEHLKVICNIIKRNVSCRLLVFGLGNDSIFWSNLNQGGVTIFIEDDKDWFENVTKKSKGIKAFLIDYGTTRTDWKTYLEDASLLDTTLPNDIEKEKWDVILVDGPAGYNDQTPGRMKSIFLSSKLIKVSGDIFVHDSEREIEDIYCNKFLGKENMKMEYRAENGFLRHYHMINHTT